jgi:integrase
LISNILLEPFRTMAWRSVCLGLEPSALVGLQWGDVDFLAGCLKIQRGVVCNHVDRAKNEYREAPLPIDPSLVAMLERCREKTLWKKPADWVFAPPYFERAEPYSPRHVAEDHLWPAAKAAGLGEKIGWGTFRCTYSSLLRELRVDIMVPQELMRHSDIRTTLNGYTDSYSNDMRNAHEKVAKELRIQ